MRRYRRKPTVIEAVQWTGDLTVIPQEWRHAVEVDSQGYLIVHTPEGPARCLLGGYLLHGTHGEFYPNRREIFEDNYEEDES
jgi:hypothetical protein